MMPKLQKLIVMLIVAFGALACVASVLRLRTLYVSTESKDVTWDKTGTVYWSTIEINVGIICSSLTTLRAMVSRLWPNLLNSREQVQTYRYRVADNEIDRITGSEITKNSASKLVNGINPGLGREGY